MNFPKIPPTLTSRDFLHGEKVAVGETFGAATASDGSRARGQAMAHEEKPKRSVIAGEKMRVARRMDHLQGVTCIRTIVTYHDYDELEKCRALVSKTVLVVDKPTEGGEGGFIDPEVGRWLPSVAV